MQSIRCGGTWKEHAEIRHQLEATVDRYKDELTAYASQLEDARQSSQAYATHLAELQARVSNLEQRLVDKDASLQHAQARITGLEAQAHVAETKATIARERRETLERQVQAQQQQLYELEQEKTTLSTALAASTEECERLRDLLYAAQEQNQYHETTNAHQSHQLSVLEHACDAKDNQIAQLTKERNTLAQRLAETRSTDSARSTDKLHTQAKASPGRREAFTASRIPVLGGRRTSRALRSGAGSNQMDDCDNASTSSEGDGTSRAMPGSQQARVAPLLHTLRSANTKIHHEQQENSKLRERIKQLELEQKDLLARFREARVARKRAERKGK